MGSNDMQGALWERPEDLNAEAFDLAHGPMGENPLGWELSAAAYGEDYPAEVQPYGMTTWWTLGRLVTHARLNPGGDLVDLGCGRGGPGLWLARATGATLVGVDWSPAAVAAATRRAPAFVPEGRARFIVGDLAASGLTDASADVVICMDAVFFAPNRIAALSEACRVLRPGGRYLFTASEQAGDTGRHAVEDWTPLLAAAGLETESREPVPRFAEQLGRMYEVWLANLGRIREELGAKAAEAMEDEARTNLPTLATGTGLFIVARRPASP